MTIVNFLECILTDIKKFEIKYPSDGIGIYVFTQKPLSEKQIDFARGMIAAPFYIKFFVRKKVGEEI